MLTFTKQPNGNYHLGFANPADRKEFIKEYSLEKADALVHSPEWNNMYEGLQDYELVQDRLFQEALKDTEYQPFNGNDWELIYDALQNYFCNGFTNLTGRLRDDWTICFVDDEAEYPFDDDMELIEIKEWWQEDTSQFDNLIEVLLTKGEIVFHKMTDTNL